MLSAQTNSLGRRYAAAPITDWFNPSTAHHSIAWSKAIFRVLDSWPRQFQDNG
jgi:hypothetical protein